MAWLDDRVWCHPKLTDLGDRAFRAWVNGIAYSTGMATGGVLTPAQQTLVGADKRTRRELITAGLWDEISDSEAVVIHDWNEHNERRDARRAADRERKRDARRRGQYGGTSAGTSAGRSTGQSAGQSTRTGAGASTGASAGTARVEGSEGSDITASYEAAPSPADSPDAQRLVAEFVYGCKQAGIEAPKRLIGQVAQETGKLIREGIHPDRIRDGYRRMVQRGIVQPSLLPNFVSEASIPPEARAANGAGMTPAQILEMTRETP